MVPQQCYVQLMFQTPVSACGYSFRWSSHKGNLPAQELVLEACLW